MLRASRVASSLRQSARTSIRNSHHGEGNVYGHPAAHHHAPSGPYELPHHNIYPNEQLFLNRKKGDPLEGWEYFGIAVMGITCYFFGSSITEKKEKSFKGWARREAVARMEAEAQGKEVQFGEFLTK